MHQLSNGKVQLGEKVPEEKHVRKDVSLAYAGGK
jgi:hypothetical protein